MSEKTFEEVLNETESLFYKSVGISMLPLIREGRDCIYIKFACCILPFGIVKSALTGEVLL